MMRFDDYDYAPAVALDLPGQQDYAPFTQLAAERPFRFLAFIGLVWGLLTGFAFWIVPGMGQISMVVGLAAAMVLCVVHFRTPLPLLASFTQPAGLLIVIHALAALVSSAMSQTPAIMMNARYFVAAVAFSLMLYVAQQGLSAVSALRAGLTAAGLIVALFHIKYLSAGDLGNPTSRLTIYLNPNSLGMICAVTALSLTDYAIVEKRKGSQGRAILLRLGILACLLILVASKSRTAAISLILGWLVLRTLYYGVVVGHANLDFWTCKTRRTSRAGNGRDRFSSFSATSWHAPVIAAK
jgi:hypothetical protein